jgi:hypothetical protein
MGELQEYGQKFSRPGRTGEPQRRPVETWVEALVDVALGRPGCAERTAEIGVNLERTNGSGGVEERVSATVLQMGVYVV